MARGAAEKASASSAMCPASALQHSKCHEFGSSAQGRYWMARDGYLFSVALAGDFGPPPTPCHGPEQSQAHQCQGAGLRNVATTTAAAGFGKEGQPERASC